MTMPTPPLSLGLTGSIGSGKSFVEGLFAKLGHPVFDADQAAREVVAAGTPGLGKIVEVFGTSCLNPDGSLDRKALAGIVFEHPHRRRHLEDIIHPLVRDREIEFLEKHRGTPFPVVSIPLLFESGADALVSHTAVVMVDEATRFERLALRADRLTPGEIARRLAAQMPQHEKAARANFVIDNSGSPESTLRQVEEIIQRMADAGHVTPKRPLSL